jgi:hypothetical protein
MCGGDTQAQAAARRAHTYAIDHIYESREENYYTRWGIAMAELDDLDFRF